MDAATWTNLLLSIVLVAATVAYVFETARMRRAQTDPCVVVYLRHMDHASSCFELVIKNIGQGLARKVWFHSNMPIPTSVFGIEKPQDPKAPNMSAGPFVRGIQALAPGEELTHMWGQFAGIEDYLSGGALKITAYYRDASLRRTFELPSVIDFAEFENLRYVKPTEVKIANSIERIQKLLESVGNGHSILQVSNRSAQYRLRDEAQPDERVSLDF